jgi:Cytochrome c554 and c-prime
MKTSCRLNLVLIILLATGLTRCAPDAGELQINIEKVLSKPKDYIGSEVCKSCHLEHFESWRNTLHSRTLQDVSNIQNVLVANINPETIRNDLEKQEKPPKIPVKDIYIPKLEEIKYIFGVQWKQGFLVEKNGVLYVAPIQYDAWAGNWYNYHEEDWDKRPWITHCAGCHTTGVNMEKNTFLEPRVGCEACHGPGSHHAAYPEASVFKKHLTIVNPIHLPASFRSQICGACHSRGKPTNGKGIVWPTEYRPGQALGLFFKTTPIVPGDPKEAYADKFSIGHHQQYNDWKQSVHAREGVTCLSCHFVHQLGMPPTQFQTKGAGSQQCLMCHKVINNNLAHSIHTFGNCIGCHMPKIVKSIEAGDTHSHAFIALLPKDTLSNPKTPNSCQTCHKHKKTDLETLQKLYDGLVQKSLLRVHQTRMGR